MSQFRFRNRCFVYLFCAFGLTIVLTGRSREQSLAQSAQPSVITSFPAPTTVPAGTVIRVDGAGPMSNLNQRFKQQFEQQFPGTQVRLATQGAELALAKLANDEVDVVAIDRPLTDAERAIGLAATLAGREKIVLIVGADNPLQTPLDAVQIVKILTGEIRDWAEVGRVAGPIQVFDRAPDNSTRLSLRRYALLKTANAAGTVVDRLSAIEPALGRNGISYATLSETRDQPQLRVVTLPDVPVADPRYPFSQPLLYVHKLPEPSPAARSFLGFVNMRSAQQAIAPVLPSASSAKSVVSRPNAPAASFITKEPIIPQTAQTVDRRFVTLPYQQFWMWLFLPLTGLAVLVLWLCIGARPQMPEPDDDRHSKSDASKLP
jgi:ABC-type phosphate transport system substrate-binding protein